MARRDFEQQLLPHLDAAFNYARWLSRSDADAEDVVQDACVRALRFFTSLRSEDARAWFLAIVRNSWYSRLARRNGRETVQAFEADADTRAAEDLDPERLLIQRQTAGGVRNAIEQLPGDFREVIVLRELEGLSYKEIATVLGTPIGTVMSRLARARERLATLLAPVMRHEHGRHV